MRNLFIVIIILMIVGSTLFAHPASKVELSYDQENHLLAVDFVHKVSDSEDHFIYEIEVKLNKKTIIEQEVDLQETTDGGAFVYKVLGLKSGDIIKVTTNCNKSGKKSAELEIE